MLAAERQKRIESLLEDKGTVRTVHLAEHFQVTDETIRRDLQVLEDNKRLVRIHGGASSLKGRPKLQSFPERRLVNVDRKRAIARCALETIRPGETYAFDSSTTAFELVSLLPDQPYRVVTNAFAVIDHIIGMEHVQLISTGGLYHPKTHTFNGGDGCIDTLRSHYIHTAYISSIGFSPTRGASEGFEEQAIFKERLVKHAEKVILLIDSSKLNKQSDYFFAKVDLITQIITDSNIDPALISEINASGIKLTIAE